MPTRAHQVRRARAGDPPPFGKVVLNFDERQLRRKVIECGKGKVLVDLAKAANLEHGDRLVTDDGRHIEVIAAQEELAEATSADIARLAWHVGNRHTPCQVERHRLLIQRDHVLEDMLRGLGANIRHVCEPFSPEGGAYDHGHAHHRHGPDDG
ncbi:MAG: urease accessory protein UreE [Rhizobiales bacterium]|nr:urease accessory protein UreE [Hyphomicrobiales bacterium]